MKVESKDYVVINADRQVLGRVASAVAKMLLDGKKVAVINAGNAVVSGDKRVLIKKYRTRLNLQDKANPEHSPYWPRRPDMLFKRIVRGMLPYRLPRGKDAYRRLLVFSEAPKEFEGSKPGSMETKDTRAMYVRTTTLKELSGLLGYERR